MTFGRRDIAEALLIVADSGLDGMTYDGAVDALLGKYYISRHTRFPGRPTRAFGSAKFLKIIGMAAREGLVEAGEHTDALASGGGYSIDPWVLRLTLEGHFFVERYGTPTLVAWGKQLRDNIPTVIFNGVVALIVALLVNWVS